RSTDPSTHSAEPRMSENDDLDAIVSELNAGTAGGTTGERSRDRSPGAPAAGGDDDALTARLRGWLEHVVQRNASDLLLVAGAPPSLRIEGVVVPLTDGPLGSEEIEDAIVPALPPHARRAYRDIGIADGSFSLSGTELSKRYGQTPHGSPSSRFRINLHHERGRAAAAIRRLPPTVPRFASLGLPPNVEALTRLPRGLVLVGGPTGSGKTTTLAALVNEINHCDARHIITIEDPIEYEHPQRKSLIEQVEIGIDAPDFPTALRAALRQAPDVIVVGEMRDPETMQIAVAAGETGHLVFSSLHTTDVATTVARIADSFPLERQNTVRQELAMALAAVLTQTLMPKIGGGLVPAAELLMVGYGARQHVRKNAVQHLHQEITITRKQGSFTLEESLAELVKTGRVDRQLALTRAGHPEELERLLT
ncbi:MAG TPA: PilT/PilU family type 4a pilus ATPase, partial [Vicinamibacterales bacterium]|nr:PilT/PilU family type 4a pilus ATPase [Vicinamibacterales bacterium]